MEFILSGKLTAKTFNGKRCCREVKKQTVLKVCRLQIASTYRKMNVFERIDRFQFDNNFFFHEKIQPMLANLMIFVEQRDWLLTDELNSTQREFHRQRFLVNILKKARPQSTMNANRS